MSRVCDVLYFLCQIFFPNWTERKENVPPTRLQRIFAAIFRFLTSRDGTGAFFSVILHIFILVILALIMIPRQGSSEMINILGEVFIPNSNPGATIDPPGDRVENGGEQTTPDDTTPESDTFNPIEPPTPTENITPAPTEGFTDAQHRRVQRTTDFVSGGGFKNRSFEGRQGILEGGGGSTPGSEAAVEMALTWLALHQNKQDGGWSLRFEDSCNTCSHGGTSVRSRRTAATALALLAFLGAGHSHQTQGKYRTVVEDGLNFLRANPNGGFDGAAILQDDMEMYSRGLAAMALCEAYAMTERQDPASRLGIAAQQSLFLIEAAQDPDYGGWNYKPGELTRKETINNVEQFTRMGGDTSIFAWQLMALKSGKLGGLQVSQSTLYAALDFLDLVAIDGGRRYNYVQTGGWDGERGKDSPHTCAAIGLLMRMYLGWKPGDPCLDEGMEQLSQKGFILHERECNLYYIYYATLALHHYGGVHWESWNSGVQELLIETQARNGCEAGSWYFPDAYCDTGGRLLNTALGAMILETPYRFMPLYRKMMR